MPDTLNPMQPTSSRPSMTSGVFFPADSARTEAVRSMTAKAPIQSGTAPESRLQASAHRLMSETAHDLRAPLTSVRESIRLVRDGELGSISQAQRECLSAAIGQCNCIGQLIDEMLLVRQFDTGFPNVRRFWVSIAQMRKVVEDTLLPWSRPRNIHLLWDGIFRNEDEEYVYADPILLRRLIVNLANNAISVTPEGQSVLIRADRNTSGGTITWSIVDQGIGISRSDLELIAEGHAPSRSTGGLGLLISRNLAAAHFSKLRIESRVGTGTVVGFQTPGGGPLDVVKRWSMWRTDMMNESVRMLEDRGVRVFEKLPGDSGGATTGEVAVPRRVRIDAPAYSVELNGDRQRAASPTQMVLTSVSTGAATSGEGCERFDVLLQRSMRVTELAYRVDRHNWVIAWDADRSQAIQKRDDLESQCRKMDPDLRLAWNRLIDVPTARDADRPLDPVASRMRELIVHLALSGLMAGSVPAAATQSDESCEPSEVPETRLESELAWLQSRE